MLGATTRTAARVIAKMARNFQVENRSIVSLFGQRIARQGALSQDLAPEVGLGALAGALVSVLAGAFDSLAGLTGAAGVSFTGSPLERTSAIAVRSRWIRTLGAISSSTSASLIAFVTVPTMPPR